MRRIICLLGMVTLLSGCAGQNREMNEAMKIRDTLLSAEGCSFQARISADYGDQVQEFSMACTGSNEGRLNFEILEPESIAGIRGSISDQGGAIHFDEQALYFPLLTDDQLTPASAPWIFLKTLRSGCITSVCREETRLHLTVDDSYEDDPLTLDIWCGEDGIPVQGDILYDGKRILTVEVEKFVFL